MQTKDDLWMQGFACALASLHRLHHCHGVIDDTLTATGVTIEHLKAAGVEEYDLDELKKCARKKSSRSRRREHSVQQAAAQQRDVKVTAVTS